MKQNANPDFILIDDEPINNKICIQVIQITISESVIQVFISPERGLEYIQSTYSAIDAKDAILFLDINMPSLSGWEVLVIFKKFSAQIKKHIKIFILSSSVYPPDKERAYNNLLVMDYIIKPLSKNKLQAIFTDYIEVE